MSFSVLLVSQDDELINDLKADFQARYPDITVVQPGESGAELAEVAGCWHPSQSLLSDYPNIKCLHSLAAGADNLGKELLGSGLPVCRIVDEQQKVGMFEYILWGVLNTHRKFDVAKTNQKNKHWNRYSQRSSSSVTIGVLGLGALGSYVAQRLADFGYTVSGWSKSQKQLNDVECFCGSEGFDAVISQSEIVVNLLPLSVETKGILNANVFNKMPENGYLINCGRGAHLVNDDFYDALKSGQLRGALLDVFDEEPMPESHPMWTTEGVIVTPHVASDAMISAIVDQVAENAARFHNNEALKNTVDPKRGY